MDEGDKPFFLGFGGGALAALLLRQRPQPTASTTPAEEAEESIPRVEFISMEMVSLASPASNPSPIPWDTVVATYPGQPLTPPPGATHFIALAADQAPQGGTVLQALALNTGIAFLAVPGGQMVPQVMWAWTGFAPLIGGEVVVTISVAWLKVVQ